MSSVSRKEPVSQLTLSSVSLQRDAEWPCQQAGRRQEDTEAIREAAFFEPTLVGIIALLFSDSVTSAISSNDMGALGVCWPSRFHLLAHCNLSDISTIIISIVECENGRVSGLFKVCSYEVRPAFTPV